MRSDSPTTLTPGRIPIAILAALFLVLSSTNPAAAELKPCTVALVDSAGDNDGGCVDLRRVPAPDGEVIRCVLNSTAVQMLERATGADGAPWQRLQINGDIGWMASANLIEMDGSTPTLTPPLAGTISGTLPHFGGTGFVVWNGGSVAQLLAAASEQGCAARSVWTMVNDRFVGYSAGAPAFVSARWLAQHPADIPGPTPLLVVCAEAGGAMRSGGTAVLDALVIGRSVQGRPIEVLCVGEGPHLVLLVGGMHTGIEKNTVTLAHQVVVEMQRGLSVPVVVRLCVLPVLNPDGLALDERTNANGGDLNRNWHTSDWQPEAYHPASGPVNAGSSPLSEPETQTPADFVGDVDPAVVVVWHSYAALVEGNGLPLAGRVGQAYAEAAGLDYVDHWDAYPITGQFIDAMEEAGVAVIDVDLRWQDDSGFQMQVAGIKVLLAELAAELR